MKSRDFISPKSSIPGGFHGAIEETMIMGGEVFINKVKFINGGESPGLVRIVADVGDEMELAMSKEMLAALGDKINRFFSEKNQEETVTTIPNKRIFVEVWNKDVSIILEHDDEEMDPESFSLTFIDPSQHSFEFNFDFKQAKQIYSLLHKHLKERKVIGGTTWLH